MIIIYYDNTCNNSSLADIVLSHFTDYHIMFEDELATVVILERKYFKHHLPLARRNNTQP